MPNNELNIKPNIELNIEPNIEPIIGPLGQESSGMFGALDSRIQGPALWLARHGAQKNYL